MNIENFTISDHADNSGGKLSIMGMFDRILVPQFPMHHPHCCLALRMRFQRSEEGQHQVKIMLVDADGHPQGFKFERPIQTVVPDGFDTGIVDLVVNLNGLPLSRPGNFYWDLVLDGQLMSRLPMYVRNIEQHKAAA